MQKRNVFNTSSLLSQNVCRSDGRRTVSKLRYSGEKSTAMQAFARLGNEKMLHEYCEIIYKLLGLVIDFISAEDETLRLSGGSNFNPFCAAIRKVRAGFEACHQCDVANGQLAARKKQTLCYRCHAELYEIIVPLFDNRGIYLGSLTSGQFHLAGTPRAGRRKISALAAKLGLNPEQLHKDYLNSRELSQKQLEGVIEYLEMIGRHLTGLHENLIFLEKINTPGKIESIRQYIEKHYRDRLSLEEVAQKFYISPSSLSHSFKKEMNVPFNAYVNSFRINEVKKQLDDTELSISEIALNCGFGSIAQFNRVFRSETGMSAGQYRRKSMTGR